MVFCLKEDRFYITDTPRSGRWRSFNTLIHNDPSQCARELAYVMNCDHSTIVRHLHSMGKVKKIGCMGNTCSMPKPQKSAGEHMCISACSSSIGSWKHRSFLFCPPLWDRWQHACLSRSGSIPGRDKFPGWGFSGFFLTCETNVRKL